MTEPTQGRPFALRAADLRRVIVTSTHYKPAAQRLAEQLAMAMEERGIEVLRDIEGTRPLDELGRSADLLVAVGGDGTLLGTARRLAGASIPVVGVNLGKLGFLAEHSFAEVLAYLRDEPSDGWRLSPKMMLQIEKEGDDAPRLALNDVIVSQGVMTRLIQIGMEVDDRHATEYRADGLVVSTPTGSTAYSLSLGGPIIGQGLRAIVVTPIAPHSLTNRPVVMEGTSKISFELLSEVDELALVIDGQERIDLRQGDCFTVCAAENDLNLVSSGRLSYFDVLRHKLSWGTRPQLNDPG